MKNDITLVTAYYDIGRKEWEGFTRDDDKYFSYFSHWARIQNQLIVYVENNAHRDRVMEIRKQFGREEKTTVVVTGDILNIDSSLYECMKKVCDNPIQRDFRLNKGYPESTNAKYDYIMALKTYFLSETVIQKRNLHNQLSWIDFGFAHGDEVYVKEEEFDFLWQYEFEKGIHLPIRLKLDDRPIFDIVRSMDVYVMGSIFIGDEENMLKLWQMMKEAVYILADCGMVDDDQTELLMMARKYPNCFSMDESEGWHLYLREHGGEHLTVRKRSLFREKVSRMKIARFRLKVKRQWKVFKYLCRQNKYLMKG